MVLLLHIARPLSLSLLHHYSTLLYSRATPLSLAFRFARSASFSSVLAANFCGSTLNRRAAPDLLSHSATVGQFLTAYFSTRPHTHTAHHEVLTEPERERERERLLGLGETDSSINDSKRMRTVACGRQFWEAEKNTHTHTHTVTHSLTTVSVTHTHTRTHTHTL